MELAVCCGDTWGLRVRAALCEEDRGQPCRGLCFPLPSLC
jgi:hypothetical protein